MLADPPTTAPANPATAPASQPAADARPKRTDQYAVGIPGVKVEQAERAVPADEPPPLAFNEKLNVIGKPTTRIDGRAKVTGADNGTGLIDRNLPGDDTPANIDLLTAALEPRGYEILAAPGGEDQVGGRVGGRSVPGREGGSRARSRPRRGAERRRKGGKISARSVRRPADRSDRRDEPGVGG